MTDKDTPGVVAPPPLIFLGFLVAGLVLNHFLALPLRPAGIVQEIGWISGGALILIGFVIFVLAFRNFTRAGTPVPTRETTRVLVTSGIHGLSRNPIYVGFFAIYAGIGVLADNAWVLVLAVPLALVVRYGVVAREERYLERRFGDDYRQYWKRVRRWL